MPISLRMLQALRQKLWQWRGVLITVPSVTAAVLGLRSLGILQQPELLALDQFFLLRPRETVDTRILIVEITEADVDRQGRWPMKDVVLAQLLETIKKHQPVAIGLDLYRNLPEEPGHAQLVQLFKTTPNLIGVRKVVRSVDSSPVAPPPELMEQEQVGANDLILDGDGKVRRGLLSVTSENKEVIPSFAAILADLYLQTQKGIELEFDGNQAKLGSVVLQAFQANDGGYIRAGDGGFQILLNYRGTIQQFQTVTMTDILENRVAGDLMRDRIVIIGSTAESLKDLFYDPYSSSLTAPTRTPGVVIHANLVSQILSSVLDRRSSLQTWNETAEWLWILVCALIGATMSWQQRYFKHPWNILGFLAVLLMAGGIVGGSFLAFLQGWWLPVVPPVMALIGSAIAITGYVALSAADMRRTFGRYVTDEVVASLLETPSGLKLGGERREVTILVSDVRGFSAISERLPPEQVVTILNLYLGTMSDIITRYNGTINEFIGDGIFVLFGAPIHREDDAQRAIACAVAMQAAMAEVNEQNQQLGFPNLEMGIGINTGEVVVGNIGSQKRAKYTVIGNHVNLAARIESYTVGGQVLISEHTYKQAGQKLVHVRGEMRVEPKGIKEPITLYEVDGINGKHKIFLPEETDLFVRLKPFVDIRYTVLEGKHLVGTVFEGQLVQISENGAELLSSHLLMPLSNLKITILPTEETAETEDLYAKVIDKPASYQGCVRIRFTGVLPEAAAVLSKLRQASMWIKKSSDRKES